MRVLVACEYSGIVRDAFLARGHDAMSCDLLPTESPGPHYQGDVRDVLGDGWDLMIGHPPCRFISYAAMRVWGNPGRVFDRLDALRFFAELWEAPIGKICLENPPGCASPTIAKYNQEIHPYYFGDRELKRTWLWLKNLPPLVHSEKDDLFSTATATEKPESVYVHTRKESAGRNRYGATKKRYRNDVVKDPKERARFWPGIAKAMASHWG